MRIGCYHARKGYLPGYPPRYGQRVAVLTQAKRGTQPRNILVRFDDGTRAVTSIGCIRWTCRHYPQPDPGSPQLE